MFTDFLHHQSLIMFLAKSHPLPAKPVPTRPEQIVSLSEQILLPPEQILPLVEQIVYRGAATWPAFL